jgi:tetratricopeptide (TPR) repeat protein
MVRDVILIEEEPEVPVEQMTVLQLIASFKKRKGKDENETLTVLERLIDHYMETEEWGEAERYIKIKADVKRTKLGSQHEDTLALIRQVIDLQLKQQKHRVAALTLKSSTKYHEMALGSNNKITLDMKISFAAVQCRNGKKVEAISLYRDIFNSVVNLEHDDNALGFGLGPGYKLDVLHPFTDLLMATRAYREAEQVYPELIATSEVVHGAKAPLTLSAMKNLAFVKAELDNLAEAETLYKEVVGLYAAVYGEEDPLSLSVLSPYAELLYQKRQDTAGPALKAVGDLYVRILAIQREMSGGDVTEEMFNTLRRMADIYTTLGDLEGAEGVLREGLSVAETLFGAKHADTITTMFLLAMAINNQQQKSHARGALALGLFQRVLSSWKVTPSYGPVHPVTLFAMVALAERYYQQSMQLEAVELLERGLVACERSSTLGRDAPATLNIAFELAKMYRKTGGELAAAEALLRRVGEWRVSRGLGPELIESLRVSAEMGLVLMDLGRYAEALEVLRAVLPGIERVVGLNHAETLVLMRGIARCLMARAGSVDNEDVFQAVEISRLCLERSEIAYGKSSTDSLCSVAVLADALMLSGKHEEAEDILTQTVSLCENEMGEIEGVVVADLMHQLGKLHAQTSRHHSAKQLSSRALAIYSSVYGEDHETTRAVSAFVRVASTRLSDSSLDGEGGVEGDGGVDKEGEGGVE